MKKLLILLLLLCSISCVRIEPGYPESVEFGYFTDSYNNMEIVCTVGPFVKGESLVRIYTVNEIPNSNIRPTFESTILTTREFQRELRKAAKERQQEGLTEFILHAKGVEITWKMFDEIRKTYEN